MSENSIDFGEFEKRFSRLRTVCFVSRLMFFSRRTGLLSCVGFFMPSYSGTLSSTDRFENCRFASFCLTYSSRSEQSFSPLSSFLRAVCVERYISVGSRNDPGPLPSCWAISDGSFENQKEFTAFFCKDTDRGINAVHLLLRWFSDDSSVSIRVSRRPCGVLPSRRSCRS